MLKIFTTIFVIAVFVACAPTRPPVPIGTIPQANMVTPSDEQYGHTVLTGLSQQYELDYNDPRLNKITEIVDRLAKAAGADKEPWHVFLFKSKEMKNAAATRGNHVFVWSGLLDSLQNDDELATVLAHEMAHLLAGHTDPDPNEQLRKILIGIGASAAGIAISAASGNAYGSDVFGRITYNATNSLGEEALINPYSREKELEADHVGLMLMAAAGYNPEIALRFWERASHDPDFASNSEYFSSHPKTSDRIENIKRAMPLALEYYHGKKFNTASLASNTQQNSLVRSSEQHASMANSKNQWITKASGTKLYRAPSNISRVLGEFKEGTTINVEEDFGDWVEISNPEPGYLKKQGLSKAP